MLVDSASQLPAQGDHLHLIAARMFGVLPTSQSTLTIQRQPKFRQRTPITRHAVIKNVHGHSRLI